MTWTVERWLPKEERSVEYYSNEYRFNVGDEVVPYVYTYTQEDFHNLIRANDEGVYVTLLSAIDNLSAPAVFAFATTTLILSSF